MNISSYYKKRTEKSPREGSRTEDQCVCVCVCVCTELFYDVAECMGRSACQSWGLYRCKDSH